jgi:hypothetical protein
MRRQVSTRERTALLPGDNVAGKKPSRVQKFSSERFTPSWVEFLGECELVLDWHVQNMCDAGGQYPFNLDEAQLCC